jgi:hypothetical protein
MTADIRAAEVKWYGIVEGKKLSGQCMMSETAVYGMYWDMWNNSVKFLSGIRLIRDSLKWLWEIALWEVCERIGSEVSDLRVETS